MYKLYQWLELHRQCCAGPEHIFCQADAKKLGGTIHFQKKKMKIFKMEAQVRWISSEALAFMRTIHRCFLHLPHLKTLSVTWIKFRASVSFSLALLAPFDTFFAFKMYALDY